MAAPTPLQHLQDFADTAPLEFEADSAQIEADFVSWIEANVPAAWRPTAADRSKTV